MVPHSTGRHYDYLHRAVNDDTCAACVGAPRRKATTCPASLRRARHLYADHGISVLAVMTDNSKFYRNALVFQHTLPGLHYRQLPTHFYHPQVNGKVARFTELDRGSGLPSVTAPATVTGSA